MLLVGALVALFVAGFWIYCLTDVALTPGSECRGLPKAAWFVVVAGTFALGGAAWLAASRRDHATHPAATATRGTRGARGTAGGGRRGDAPDARDTEDPEHAATAPVGRDRPLPPDGRPDPRDWNGRGNDGRDGSGIAASLEAEAALLRHPAGRARRHGAPGRPRPKGPDDDPDFLQALNRAIKGLGTDDGPAR